MSIYTSKDQWQTLYEDPELKQLREKAIEKLNISGNQTHPGTMNAAEELWDLCVAVADRIKGAHTKIGTGRQFNDGKAEFMWHEVIDSSSSEKSITLTVGGKTLIFGFDDFKSVLDCFRLEIYGLVNVRAKKGWKRENEKLEKVLPMISLGVFEVSGKDWIDIEEDGNDEKNFKEFIAGEVGKYNIGNGVSLTGHFENKEQMRDIVNLGEKMNIQISEIVDLLELRNNVILEGVPGTGKTWIRNEISDKMNATLESTTFHPAKTYEEFVGGIFPQNEHDELHFNYLEGTVAKIANKAMKDNSGGKYILFIDEINRANIPMVMGELLTIIESTKRTSPDGDDALKDESTDSTWEVAIHTEPNLTKYLRLPSNLYILATMNTSDRSVLSMDAALRRRFAYYRIETKLVDSCMSDMKDLLRKSDPETFWHKRDLLSQEGLFDIMFGALAEINEKILKKRIGPDAMLGHSYLFVSEDELKSVSEDEVKSLSDEEAVSEILQLSILPQIADILTSMNQTDAGIVTEINSKLRPLEDLGASHYVLKEPIDNKNSLDIAVTVVRGSYDDAFDDPEVLFEKDESIFRTKSKDVCSYIQHVGEGKVKVLIGSTIGSSFKYSDDPSYVRGLVERKIISSRDDGNHYVFIKEHESTNNRIGRLVSGRISFEGAPLWKNNQDKNLRDYYPDDIQLMGRADKEKQRGKTNASN
jgi:hypothetical protein